MCDAADKHDCEGLGSVLADYLMQMDRGEAVCRDTILEAHPEIAAELRQYFADVDLIKLYAGESHLGGQNNSIENPRAFGEYELLSVLGRGGMGIVYRAKERSTGRDVALKMLPHGWFSNSAAVLRFRNESRNTAALRHAGIVPIYRVGEHEGRLYYTMPLIEGSNLAERIAAGPLEPANAAKMLLTLAEAVAEAHAHGIIHRDLKPANVLLDQFEAPYVADFGLARRLEDQQPGITLTGDMLGTPNYMAPEQVDGRNSKIGPLTDVYALGAILYAMLIGKPPFQSDSVPDTLHKIGHAEPVRPRQLRRGVPRDLETICLKCLEKSPAARYATTEDLAEDLRRFLAGKPLLAQPITRLERTRRWFVRNPVVGTLAVGIALALIAGMGFSLHYARQAEQREQQALANLYAADMTLAQQHVRSGAVASAMRLLERHRKTPGAVEGQGWEWRQLWHQCHGELRRFDGPQGAVYAAAFGPDGRTIVAAGDDKIAWLWETATGKVLHKLAGHTATIRDLAFAPDGKRLVTISDDGVGLVWDIATGKQIATLRTTSTPGPGQEQRVESPHLNSALTTVAFSSSGRLVVTGGNNIAQVHLWDAESLTLRQSLDLGPVESVAFAPGGTRLALAGRDGNVRICASNESGSWLLAETIQAHGDLVRDVAWSADGTRLATAGADRKVTLWDAASWRQLESFGPLKESAYSVSFSPDGRRLAASIRNEAIKVWEIDQPQNVVELLGHTALATAVDFCPDGWRILSGSEDGTVRLWDAARATDHDRLEGHLGRVRAVAFSPKRNILATGGLDDGAIILWDTTSRQPLRVLRIAQSGFNDLSFSPDGTRLATTDVSGWLRVWNVASGSQCVAVPLGINMSPLFSVVWSPNGEQLALIASDDTIQFVEASSGRQIASWASPNGHYGNVAFSDDGELLLSCGDESIRVWEAGTHRLLRQLTGDPAPVVYAEFNPTRTLVASSSSNHTICLWDANTGEQLHTLTGHGGTPCALAFSPDGTRLASSSRDETVKVWDVATGLQLASLVGHRAWARDVAFSPDGNQLACVGYDGAVRIWHTSTMPGEDSAKREAAALVNHLAESIWEQDSLLAAIRADRSIREAVKTAAIVQAERLLSHWKPLAAGHRAAQRRDWPAAMDAFKKVTMLAPKDVIHWYWLAMASMAANRHETYDLACNEMLHLCGENANIDDRYWTLKAWLAARRDGEMTALLALLDCPDRFGEFRTFPWLYKLRTGIVPKKLVGSSLPFPAAQYPEEWYILAMLWSQAGDSVQARSAYQQGLFWARTEQNTFGDWSVEVYRNALRREVEAMLKVEPDANRPPADNEISGEDLSIGSTFKAEYQVSAGS